MLRGGEAWLRPNNSSLLLMPMAADRDPKVHRMSIAVWQEPVNVIVGLCGKLGRQGFPVEYGTKSSSPETHAIFEWTGQQIVPTDEINEPRGKEYVAEFIWPKLFDHSCTHVTWFTCTVIVTRHVSKSLALKRHLQVPRVLWLVARDSGTAALVGG